MEKQAELLGGFEGSHAGGKTCTQVVEGGRKEGGIGGSCKTKGRRVEV